MRTGSSREVAKQAQTAGKFSFRSWWDVPPAGGTESPIGGAWNVLGWPATYVIDGDGIIRFVDVRDEDLLKGVRQLLEAQADRDAAAARRQIGLAARPADNPQPARESAAMFREPLSWTGHPVNRTPKPTAWPRRRCSRPSRRSSR